MGREPSVEVENTSVSPGGVTKVPASAVHITEAKMGPPSFEWEITYLNDRAEELIDFTDDGLVGTYVWDTFEWGADSTLRTE